MKLEQDHPRRPSARPAFTLIELLVVIFIIAILISLTAGGVLQIIDVQRQNNTTDNMQTVSEVLRKQWDKVVSDAKKETGLPDSVYSFAGGDAARARVLWIKARLVEAFPISYAEINNPWVYTNLGGNLSGPLIPTGKQKYVATYQKIVAGRSSKNPATESAACLLMALTINRGGVKLDPDKVSTADTDGDGLKELIDGWGVAETFFRFPTGNSDLQASNPAPAGSPGSKFCDPLDPTGTLANSSWGNNQAVFQQFFHKIFFTGSSTPTVYTIPVLVSSGHNGLLGLDATMAVTGNTNDSNDNIFSYRLRQGGNN